MKVVVVLAGQGLRSNLKAIQLARKAHHFRFRDGLAGALFEQHAQILSSRAGRVHPAAAPLSRRSPRITPLLVSTSRSEIALLSKSRRATCSTTLIPSSRMEAV